MFRIVTWFNFEKNAHVLLVVIAFTFIRNLLSNTIYRVFYKKLDLPTPPKLRKLGQSVSTSGLVFSGIALDSGLVL